MEARKMAREEILKAARAKAAAQAAAEAGTAAPAPAPAPRARERLIANDAREGPVLVFVARERSCSRRRAVCGHDRSVLIERDAEAASVGGEERRAARRGVEKTHSKSRVDVPAAPINAFTTSFR
jgi:hypothetical protein